jgi:Mg/Co/Ni transporter MgtE
VIHLKKLDYPQCIDFSSRALNLVENFQNETKLFSK